MFLTMLSELDTACHALSPTDHLHVLKTTLASELPRKIRIKLEKLELLDAVIEIREYLLHTCELVTLTIMKHDLYKKIQKLEQELNLTETSYHLPERDWNQSFGKSHHITRQKESLMLHIPDELKRKEHSFLSSPHHHAITIHVSVLDTHVISTMIEQLNESTPTFTKQDALGRPTQIEFQMTRPPPGKTFTRKDAFEHCCVFYGNDPTINTYLDFINYYAFRDTLPRTITNILREITGQPLLEYPSHIYLPDVWPEAQPTNTRIY